MKAQSNWEEKSQYLLREIVKYDLYIDSLQIAMSLRLKKRGEKGMLFTLCFCIITESMFKLWSMLSMAPVQPTKRSQSRMGYQRKNPSQLSQASDIHVERGGSETNDNDINLIFFVMDIPPECSIHPARAGERFPQSSDFLIGDFGVARRSRECHNFRRRLPDC
jgi:hypothetical protein